MKYTLLVVIVLLAACSLREATPAATPVTTSATPEPPAPPATPPSGPTPPLGGTVSSEPVGGTSGCTPKAHCVTYTEKDGTPAELCAHYDETGCYHSYACSPSGELVQKETPAFCGRS